ncbi:MAG: tryptophan-rich sensory protein [Clostridia bacterium]|nr:tryptophan-rich sensory protein [Clostridia bacterium]
MLGKKPKPEITTVEQQMLALASKRRSQRARRLCLSVAISMAAACVFMMLSNQASPWYMDLVKPFFALPPVINSLGWLAVHASAGVALAAVLDAPRTALCRAAFAHMAFLALAQWAFAVVFYRLYAPAIGFLLLGILLFAAFIAAGTVRKATAPPPPDENAVPENQTFSRGEWGAAFLLPYIIWTGYTLIVQYCIVIFN